MEALSLAGVTADGDTARVAGMLPSARVRRGIDQLVELAEPISTDGLHPTLGNHGIKGKALLKDVLEWDTSGKHGRATKPVMKAAAELLESDPNVGTDALSFLALWTPLDGMEPDRLVRILEHATGTANAYQPVRYPQRLAAQIRRMLGHYPADRLELLATSLWDAYHNGRWWDATTGSPGRRRRRRRTRPANDVVNGRRRGNGDDQGAGALAAALDGDDQALIDTLIEGHGSYSTAVATRLQRLDVPEAVIERLANVAVDPYVDPDVPVLLSYLPGPRPQQRPPSPVEKMLDALETAMAPQLAANEDEARPARSWSEVLPEKPTAWEELYPHGSLTPYPIPPELAQFDDRSLPGTGTDGVPAAVLQWIHNQHELVRNGKAMSNCTGGYHSRMAEGSTFVGKVLCAGSVYNFEWRRAHGTGTWTQSQLSGVANNSHAVPQTVRDGLARALASVQR